MRKRYLIANWKMNPPSVKEARKLFSAFLLKIKSSKKLDVVICPPSLYLSELKKIHPSAKKLKFGLQNVFSEDAGPFTGEISPRMAFDIGVRYVIVGHSERRAMGETNEIVGEKTRAVLRNGLIPIICIGEIERDEDGQYLSFLREEIESALEVISLKDLKNVIIAYEPIWAIGKTEAEAANARDLEQSVLFIKKILKEFYGDARAMKTKIIYGGSVEEGNVGALLTGGGIDGFLVGHSSLDKKSFIKIFNSF